ncbi:MAG: hypothetical protein A3H28_02235 [Acidobacteria bacterium RIFCSPLOWO2_02_FULL_61_28]|nr:MAG: hypothetical protein A3H28_02235 [Acidobacteria bacterium RIFCSPLOWO2_02_FULL_61_28]
MTDRPKKDFKVEPMQAHTLTWWRNRHSQIDMDPPYQRRGHLWSATDKAYLIDSILNGFDVPKIYMADFTWGDSPLNRQKKAYAIIDGKQRLEAIFDFFEGNIVLNKDFKYLEEPSLSLGSLGYHDLKKRYPQVAETFDEYNPLVMRVAAQDENPITELFVRLNRSKSLTGAEIRNAMSGPAPELFRQIAKHDLFRENVSFTVTRGQDLNAAAKILYFEHSSDLRETKKANLDQFVKNTKADAKGLELAARKVVDVLDSMSGIFLPHDKLLSSAGVFPVYYWFVKHRPVDDFPYIREFLVRFEEQRHSNRELAATNPNSRVVDQELLQYDRQNRSTDDAKSHKARFKVLGRRFTKFVKAARR